MRRASTPSSDVSQTATPIAERKQLYEAESPDELSLVDAACTYNIRLLQRSIYHVIVSLPGDHYPSIIDILEDPFGFHLVQFNQLPTVK